MELASTSTTPALYSAVPKLTVSGKEQPGLSEGLKEITVEETTAGLLHCEATILNWGPTSNGVSYLYYDRNLLDFGKPFKIEAGAGEAAGSIFEGRIMGMEGRYFRVRPPELLLFAEDRLQDLRMTRRTRSFASVSDNDMFQKIASEHGLTTDLDISGPQYNTLTQVNQSDLAFLRERARAIDAELWIEGTTLHAKARSRRKTTDLTLNFGERLYEFSVLADLALQMTGMTVSGWDVAGKQTLTYRADDSALSSELNGDLSGTSVLQQALGKRDQQVVHLLPATSAEAQALAQSEYRRAARRFLTGMGVAEGDSRIRVGTKLQLKNLGTSFTGAYYVTRTRHTFDLSNGYRTWFEVERPGLGH